MKININDFPIGTKINVVYNNPITDYYNDILPTSYSVCCQFNAKDLGGYYAYKKSCPFLYDKIDFSKIEYLYLACEIGNYPKVNTEEFILNFPNIKYLEFSNFNPQDSELKKLIINMGENLESFRPYFDVSSNVKKNLIVEYNSNSQNINSIANLKIDFAKEYHINLDCSKVNPYTNTYSNLTNLTYHSGFPNVKQSQNDNYYYIKCPNLTRESYLSIFNNLYDFVCNNETPSSSQGKLKISTNAQSICTEEDFNIPTSKGWVISFG
jgi:hypothetical protein